MQIDPRRQGVPSTKGDAGVERGGWSVERDDLWVAVIDYGVGNLRNVYKALEAAGAPAADS